MESEWDSVLIGDVVDSCLGKMLDKKKNKGEFQPYLGNSNVRWGSFELDDLAQMKFEPHEEERYGLKKGDLIVCEGGEPGRCALWDDDIPDMKIQKALHRVRPYSSLRSEYLFYWFSYNGRLGRLEPYFTGTTIKHLTGKALAQLPIKIPPLEYQDYCVKHLKKIDEKIRLNQKTNQTLEQMAQALFKSWFVDFDPVIDNALAAANAIPDELQHRVEIRKKAHALQKQNPNIKLLPEATQRLFPSEFEHCGDNTLGIQGWIPKGWVLSNTNEEFGIKGGSTPSTKNPDFWDGGEIHWTSPKDLSGNHSKILLDTSRKITEAGLAKITSGLLPLETVLMSSRAPVGYLAIAKVPVAINQGYIALSCAKTLSPEYTIQFLDYVMDEIKSISGGTTFAEISKKTFRSIKLIVPSKSLVEAFTGIAKAQYDKITENIKQSNNLIDTRDYLLPKLISGELVLSNDHKEI